MTVYLVMKCYSLERPVLAKISHTSEILGSVNQIRLLIEVEDGQSSSLRREDAFGTHHADGVTDFE